MKIFLDTNVWLRFLLADVKEQFEECLELFSQVNIKLANCLIAAQLPKNTLLCSFDQEFKKVKGLQTLTPGRVLEQKTGGAR